MIRVSVRMVVAPEKQDEVLLRLREIARRTRGSKAVSAASFIRM